MSFLDYFYLQENPFGETPDPRFYFPARAHEEALQQLAWAIDEHKGFLLILGDAGSGKTTLSRVLYAAYGDEANFAFVLNPSLRPEELLSSICRDFGFPSPPGRTPDLEFLQQVLLQETRKGKRHIVVVDEAQHLSNSALEFIRLLSNLETDHRKLIQVILMAQPELEERLLSPELRQLEQRIFLRTKISFLTVEETSAYVRHRIERAGGGHFIRFDNSAIAFLHKLTAGAPRLINRSCELALRFAAIQRTRHIDVKFLRSLPLEQAGLRAPRTSLIELIKGVVQR